VFRLVRRPPNTGHSPLQRAAYWWGLHGYVLTPRGAKRLLEIGVPVAAPADVHLATLAFRRRLNVYAADDKLCKQATQIWSDIQHTGKANAGVDTGGSHTSRQKADVELGGMQLAKSYGLRVAAS